MSHVRPSQQSTVSTNVISSRPKRPTSIACHVPPKYALAAKMPGAGARALARNVFFYDLRDPSTQLGGLVLTPGITNASFHSLVEIVIVFSSPYFLQTDSGDTLPRDPQPLLPGNYFVVADSPITVNDEAVITRTKSLSTGTRLHSFRDEVRERDGRCVVSKVENQMAQYGMWAGFEAAHIFPLAWEYQWKNQNFRRWITLPARNGEEINSVQNGLLLSANLHVLFDQFLFSINPDDDYKIICFVLDNYGIAGLTLDRRLLDDDRRPAPELLRWHFRQSVLANMRGAGEPIFEEDFPPGSDIMGDIRTGPKAAERMEVELFSRLGASMKLDHERQ